MYSLTLEQESLIKTNLFNKGDSINIRGWNLNLPKDRIIKPSISEITSTFCRSKRNIYLKFIMEIEAIPSKAMIMGGMCHSIIAHIFKKAKDFQNGEMNYNDLIKYCIEFKNDNDLIEELVWDGNQLDNLKKFCDLENLNYEEELDNLIVWLQVIIDFEINRIKNNWFQIKEKKMIINDVEGWVDGSILETGWGKVDFIASIDNEPIIFDLKTGSSYKENLDYKIQIAAYALALEKNLNKQINIGCLVFPLNKEDKMPISEPFFDYFLIEDRYRELFFNRRDEIFEILESDKPPEIIDTFPCQWCGYNYYCNQYGGNK